MSDNVHPFPRSAPPPLLGLSQRQPPCNPAAEQSLLGAILANNRAFHLVSDFLRPEHFSDSLHQRLFRELGRRILDGGTPDAVSLKTWMESDPDSAEVGGGSAYLAMLLTAVVGIINAAEYGRAIHDAFLRREMIAIGEHAVDAAFDSEKPTGDTAAEVAAQLDRLLASGSTDQPGVEWNEALERTMSAIDLAASGAGITGVSTGMASVDDALGGLDPGTLNILGGRPGMGKSAIALQWAIAAARAGHGVCIFSLEMSAVALTRRAIAAASGVSVTKLRRGWINHVEGAIVAGHKSLMGLPITIEDAAGLSVGSMLLRARKARRKHGSLGLIVVDHLHIVEPDSGDVKQGATWAVGRVSKALHALAKSLHVPVLALAQLSRAVEGRDDKRPTKSDLRMSGDIEQNAETITFIYRPEYYLPKVPPEKSPGESGEKFDARLRAFEHDRIRLAGKAELIMAKVRDGEESIVPLRWHGETTRFSEASE